MTPEHQKQLVKRVIVERRGQCIINSPLNPPATRAEVEDQQWSPSGIQSFSYDDSGVVIISTL